MVIDFSIFIFPIIILFGIFFFVLWIAMLVDALKRNFKKDSDKIVWILVIILAGLIGAIIYHEVVYKKDKSAKGLKVLLWIILILLIIAIVVPFILIMTT